MWICPNCGQHNQDTDAVCPACQSPMPEQEPMMDQVPVMEQEPIMNQEPVMDQDLAMEQEPEATDSAAPKKKKGLKIIGIVAAVLVLVGVVLGIMIGNSPSMKVMRAAKKTVAAFQKTTGKTDSLEQWMDSFESLKDASSVQENLSLTLDQAGSDELTVEMGLALDNQKKCMGGEVIVVLPGDIEITLSIYGDQEGMSFAVPRLLDDVLFTFTYDDIAAFYNEIVDLGMTGDQLNPFAEQERFQSSLAEEESKAIETAIRKLITNMKVEDAEDYTPASSDLTAYTLVFRQEDRELLASALEDYSNALGQSFNMTAYAEAAGMDEGKLLGELWGSLTQFGDPVVCINKKGYLSVISISQVELSLMGEENPWNDFLLSVDGMELLQGGIEGGDDGISLRFDNRTKTPTTLTYKDTDGTFCLTTSEGKVAEGSIAVSNGKPSLSLNATPEMGEISLSFSMSDGAQTPTPITGSTVYNIFDMTEEDTQELTMKLVQALLADAELFQMLSDLGGV